MAAGNFLRACTRGCGSQRLKSVLTRDKTAQTTRGNVCMVHAQSRTDRADNVRINFT